MSGSQRTVSKRAGFVTLLLVPTLVAGLAAQTNTSLSASIEDNARKGRSSVAERTAPLPPTSFRNVSAQAGLTTVPHSSSERRYIVETMGGGGIALFDCDNDGRLDIAVVNDSTIDRYLAGGDLMLTLYRQDGSPDKLHFTDLTVSAGLTTRGWGMGIAVVDFDNDGLPDLYVTGYGHNVLYRNLGGCKFEDVTAKAGVSGGGFSTGAAWADYDRDGYVDLFVARYVHTDLQHLPPPDPKATGYRSVILQMPDEMEGESDILFRNRGDGTFEDVSRKAGVDNSAKLHGMGVAWGDYDDDGWPDLYVTNDGGLNYLFHNNGNGTFTEDGLLSGTAIGAHGEVYGNMAADFGDFNRDGRLDLAVSRYGRQPLGLYRNDQSAFTDVANVTGLTQPSLAPVKWGVGFADFDNDGWPDLLVANGNFSSLMDRLESEVKYGEPLLLFRNLDGKRFEEIATQAGLNDGQLESRRGTAIGDIDNDGNLDFVVFNAAGPPSLFLNATSNANHRVLFRLVGRKSNRMGIGARVTVTTDAGTQIDEVHAGGGYLSSNDTRLHFGLGNAPTMSKVEVRWPSGQKQEYINVPADALYEIDEEHGLRRLTQFAAPLK